MDNVVNQIDSNEELVTQSNPTDTSSISADSNEGQSSEQKNQSVDWEKRYKDSSREAQKYREAAEQYQAELLEVATASRDTFEQYVSKKGFSPEEKEYYMQVYDSQIAPQKAKQQISQVTEPKGMAENKTATMPTPVAQPMPPYREAWMAKMDMQEMERMNRQREATSEFFSREENENLSELVKYSIRTTAAMLDQEFGYEPKKALEVARQRVLNPESLQDEGYIQGVRDSFTGGISRGISGASVSSQTGAKLPQRDEFFVQSEIQRQGLKGAAADQFRQRYAERLARRNK